LGRDEAEEFVGRDEIFCELLVASCRETVREGLGDGGFGLCISDIGWRVVERFADEVFDLFAQVGNGVGKLFGAARSFADPEGDTGGLAVGIFDAKSSGIDAQDTPGSVAELKDVAGEAFDGEVFVNCADESFAWFENDAVIGVFRDCATGGEGQQACATTSADPMVDGVMMEQRTAASAFGAESFSEHFQHLIEFVAGEVVIGHGAAHEREEGLLVPIAGCGGGDDLLGQNVEWLRGNFECIQFAFLRLRSMAVHSTSSSRVRGKILPLGVPPCW